jgi:uncharacterized protein YbaR (Trm112 family)
MEQFPAQLLDILVCPKCRTKVRQTANGLACTNRDCRLIYPVRNGIPVMLTEEAVRADETTA